MADRLFTNNATTLLAASITAGATSLSVTSGDGANFPSLSGGDTFTITVTSADGTVQEIMEVTARSTDDMTVTRAQEGTSAEPFIAGAVVEIRLTAAWFDDNIAALALKAPLASPTFTGTVTIPDDAYDATGWNGNLTVPTKNAVRDKIEAMASGLYSDEQAQDAVGTILVDTTTIDLTYNDGTPSITAAIVSSAPLPGSPTTTTQSYGDSSTKVATTAFVQAALATSIDDGNSSTADTIDFSAGNVHKSTLTGNCTYTFTAPPTGSVVVLKVIQGSGPYTVTWPGTVKWPAGAAPTLTTTNAHMDVFTFLWDGTDYFGVVSGQDYTP